jgi:hypothetical protein
MIDGQETAKFGPLALALVLGDVPFRAVPMTLQRSGHTLEVHVFGEGVVTDGTTKATPSYSLDMLQMRNRGAPPFSLPDLTGRVGPRQGLDAQRGHSGELWLA